MNAGIASKRITERIGFVYSFHAVSLFNMVKRDLFESVVQKSMSLSAFPSFDGVLTNKTQRLIRCRKFCAINDITELSASNQICIIVDSLSPKSTLSVPAKSVEMSYRTRVI